MALAIEEHDHLYLVWTAVLEGIEVKRLEDLQRLYRILGVLEERLGGARMLSECNGRLNWPQRGVYFFMERAKAQRDRYRPAYRARRHARPHSRIEDEALEPPFAASWPANIRWRQSSRLDLPFDRRELR